MRDVDLKKLDELLKDHADELTDAETEAFADMRFQLAWHQQLTDKQRAWVMATYERIVPQRSRWTASDERKR